jgi:hypothetical protein
MMNYMKNKKNTNKLMLVKREKEETKKINNR